MKGFKRHIAASVAITAVFVICALGLSVAAVPVSAPSAQASRNYIGASLTDSLAQLLGTLDEVAEIPASDPVVETAQQTAPAPVADVAVVPAPADTVEPAPEPEASDPQQAAPKPPPEGINAPADLAGTFVPDMSPYVELTWNGNNGNRVLDYFIVYRVDAADPGNVSIFKGTKKAEYRDSEIIAGHTYTYWVTAVAKWGEESEPSNKVEVVTFEAQAPAAPQGFTAVAVEPGVNLDWESNCETCLAGYNVYISRGNNTKWNKLNKELIKDNFYYYENGVAGETYAVSAVNVYGIESAYSQAVAQAVPPRLYQEDDPAVSMEGFWAGECYPDASAGRIAVAMNPGDKLHFQFTGRQVKVISAYYWSCGSARIYIDGTLMGTVNLYSAEAAFQSVTLSAPGLKYGKHTVTVEVVGSGNPEGTYNFVNVDAFEVL